MILQMRSGEFFHARPHFRFTDVPQTVRRGIPAVIPVPPSPAQAGIDFRDGLRVGCEQDGLQTGPLRRLGEERHIV